MSKSSPDNLNRNKEGSLSCWYTNATSLNNKYNDLLIEINCKKPQIIIICETWWTEASATNIIGYSLFRKDRTDKKGGGVCIFVEESIKSYSISHPKLSNKNIEQVWCVIEVGGEKILFSENFLFQNVNKNTFQNNVNETTNILDYILTESQHRILALNHLPPLGNIDHGHHILVFNYTYLNDIKKTKLIKSKMLYNKGKFSDLNLFFTNIDWDLELVGPNIDEVYNKFLTFYNEGCNKFIPTKQFHEQLRTKSLWLTKELRHLIKEKKTAWFKCRNSGSKNIELTEKYKFLNKQVKKRVRLAVMKFEKEIVLDAKLNPKRIYAYINSKTKIKECIRALRESNEKITTDTTQIANTLNNYFVSVFCNEEIDDLPICEESSEESCDVKCVDPLFDKSIIKLKLMQLNTNKAIGVDKIHPNAPRVYPNHCPLYSIAPI